MFQTGWERVEWFVQIPPFDFIFCRNLAYFLYEIAFNAGDELSTYLSKIVLSLFCSCNKLHHLRKFCKILSFLCKVLDVPLTYVRFNLPLSLII